jgi:hypothetical protein
MKRITTTLVLLVALIATSQAQDLLGKKWYQFTIGGKKGYFVKTTEFSQTTMTENQFGSGSTFDNSPVEIKVAEIYPTTGDEVRVITDYGDSTFYVLVFKNFTDSKVSSCMSRDKFTTIEEAKTYVPAEEYFSDWYTEKGYKAEEKKPAMPEMTRNDAVAFAKYFAKAYKDLKAKMDAKAKTDDAGMGNFALVMMLATVPSQYAALKGFNQYKSMAVIERGLTKYQNDSEIKKIMSSIGLDKTKK